MSTTRLSSLAALLAAAALLYGAGGLACHAQKSNKDEKAESDKEKLQGSWESKSIERKGEKIPPKMLSTKMIFTGDKLTVETSFPGFESKAEGSYTLNPDKKPKELDITYKLEDQGEIREATKKCIYELEGNRLKVCIPDVAGAAMRPTKFDSRDGSYVMILRKQK